MKKRFTEEQITGLLREADARWPVKELGRHSRLSGGSPAADSHPTCHIGWLTLVALRGGSEKTRCLKPKYVSKE